MAVGLLAFGGAVVAGLRWLAAVWPYSPAVLALAVGLVATTVARRLLAWLVVARRRG